MNSVAAMTAPCGIRQEAIPNGSDHREMVFWVVLAAGSFHVAYLSAATSWVIFVYFLALLRLSASGSGRKAFYGGLVVGLLIAIGRLDFFWRIFSFAAVALWLVYAFWIAAFVACARLSRQRFPFPWILLGMPFLWCGMEYFRSELYYLRFTWLTPGLAFGLDPAQAPLRFLGTYGLGFFLMSFACGAEGMWEASKPFAIVILIVGALAIRGLACIPLPQTDPARVTELRIAGIQLEFPSEKEVIAWLNELDRRQPDAGLLVLSEYTFTTEIPETVKRWCREHHRYLIIGGREPVSATRFYNTAFVISPSGEIEFQQAKRVPIQFFDDGLPAPQQALWRSPWGPIGICICYDLSYVRVTDRLIQLGAQLLIVPTMDVADWGYRQHKLHGRIGPVRAAEYQIPIFRLASSGISQAIDPAGHLVASAPFPGNASIIAASLPLRHSGRRPVDRWLAPFSTAVSGLLLMASIRKRRMTKNILIV
jgi:apolipoprotein N-acyltransferase